MLYRSTRSKLDSYTSYKALRMEKSDNGGQILPLRVPYLDETDMKRFKDSAFLQVVSDILNRFFTTDITPWDLYSAVGKTPLQIVECGQKTILAQYWKNPGNEMEYLLRSIFSCICKDSGAMPTSWSRVAIRTGLIAATVMQVSEKGTLQVDLAVNAGDFEQVLSAYYCKRMGLPVRNILIACNENSNIWDFVNRGTIHCGAPLIKTGYPCQDAVIPELFEHFLFLAYGYEETEHFVHQMEHKRDYQLPEDADILAAQDFFVSVVSQERIPMVLNSFKSNNGVTVNPYTAFSLATLQDYRAKAGESSLTIVFEESAP